LVEAILVVHVTPPRYDGGHRTDMAVGSSRADQEQLETSLDRTAIVSLTDCALCLGSGGPDRTRPSL
jgi:hypothetical protein